MIQNEKVLDEIIKRYKKPRHKIAHPFWNYKSEAENPLCGDNITMYLHYKNGVVTMASFNGVGCSISQGCADLLCERLIGLTKEEVNNLQFDLFDLEKSPISKSRHKCATLSLKALNGNIKEDKEDEKNND